MREGYEDAPPVAELSAADRAMLDFAIKLTRDPRAMARDDVEILRAAGFSDTAIHDIVQITGLFAYYNRLADGLGIEPEALDDPGR
jgi:uncharacterized peroxidase-related enzyme